MKPLKLIMSAFGPYAETQLINFMELGNRSFFLICGPTGSGKTTILDAICFALYGDTSGTLRDGKQMRSDHADPSVVTEVIFDFAIGSDIYRIKRCPEQERPKKRGEGTTSKRADANLWKRTGITDATEEGAVWASGFNNVTLMVERLLGFKSDQFRQVVMLPQGEFRKLLTSNSSERQMILEALFRTEFFRRIENFFKESTKELKKDIENLLEQKKWILQESRCTTREELEERFGKHVEKLDVATKTASQKRDAVKKAQQQLNDGQKAREKLEEKNSAAAKVVQLESRMQKMEAQRQEFFKSRQALGLEDAEKVLKSRRKEISDAEKSLALKVNELKRVRVDKEKTEKVLAIEKDKEKAREAAIREVDRLEELTDKVMSLTKVREKVVRAIEQVKTVDEEHNQVKVYLTNIQNVINQKTQLRDEAAEKGAKIDALEVAYKQSEQINAKRKLLDLLHQQCNDMQKSFNKAQQISQLAEKNYNRAKEELIGLQEAWRRGQAYILASGLIEGVPCPVCGSLEHPAPPSSNVRVPNEEDIKDKQKQVNNLEKYQNKVKDELNQRALDKATIESKVRDLESELGEKSAIDLVVLQTTAKKDKQLWDTAVKAAETTHSLTGEIGKLKEKEITFTEQLDTIEKSLQQANVAYETAQTIVRERESDVPEGIRDLNALKNAQKTARNKRDRLMDAFEQAKIAVDKANQVLIAAETAAKGSHETLQVAQMRVAEEENIFMIRLKAAGFMDLSGYELAKRTPEEIQKMELDIKNFDESLRAARDRLERAVQASEGLSEPNLERLANILREAEKARDEALTMETQLRSQIEQENNWLKKLGSLNNSLCDRESRYSLLGNLSDVTNGKNKFGLTFQRFVLGALLDDVTLAATERLKLMSRGRYQLQRTLERARSNAAGGLELEVFDSYTGVARGVATLSGGEIFLASLSLALGLADVVQSYTGGMHLDTIFIDEGFGTLDPESLDSAMRTLIDLQKGGRLVGVISHVPELKELIDARLEISFTKKGSAASFKVF